MGADIRLLHLSDIHALADPTALLFGTDTEATLAAVLDTARSAGPFDAVVVTGDIADDGKGATYERLAATLRGVAAAQVWVPGNHDRPEAIAAVAAATTTAAVSTTWARDGWEVHAVDTTVAGSDDGEIGEERLERLDAVLRNSTAEHVAIALHHPPIAPCAKPLCRVADAEALLAVLARHASPRAVLSGHLHRTFAVERDGITFLGAPSTCVQADHEYHVLTDEPPAAQAVTLHDDGRVSVDVLVARARG